MNQIFFHLLTQVKNDEVDVNVFTALARQKYGNNQPYINIWLEIAQGCVQPNEPHRCEKAAKFFACSVASIMNRGFDPSRDF